MWNGVTKCDVLQSDSTNVVMNTNMQGIVCLGKIMFICNKQHSSNI